MRRLGRGWDLCFFLGVRKRHPRFSSLPKEGGAAGDPSVFDAFVPPFFAGGIPCRLFYCLLATEPLNGRYYLF